MFALAYAEVATEQLLFELGDLGADFAILVAPLIHCRVGEVVGVLIISAGLLDIVVNRNCVDPASVLGALSHGRSFDLADGPIDRGHVEGGVSSGWVGRIAVVRASIAAIGFVVLPVSHGGVSRKLTVGWGICNCDEEQCVLAVICTSVPVKAWGWHNNRWRCCLVKERGVGGTRRCGRWKVAEAKRPGSCCEQKEGAPRADARAHVNREGRSD